MGRINELLIVGIVGLIIGLLFVFQPKKVIEFFWRIHIILRLPESEKPKDKQGREALLRKLMNAPYGPITNTTGCSILIIMFIGLMCIGLGGMFLFAYFNP